MKVIKRYIIFSVTLILASCSYKETKKEVKTIEVYNEEGKLCFRIGEQYANRKKEGEKVIKLSYSKPSAEAPNGHWSPLGIQLPETNKYTNECLFQSVAFFEKNKSSSDIRNISANGVIDNLELYQSYMPEILRLNSKQDGSLYMGAGLGSWCLKGMRKLEDMYAEFKKTNPKSASAIKFLIKSAEVGVLFKAFYSGNTAGLAFIADSEVAINKISEYLEGKCGKVTRDGLATLLQRLDKDIDRDSALYGSDKILAARKFAAKLFINRKIGKGFGSGGDEKQAPNNLNDNNINAPYGTDKYYFDDGPIVTRNWDGSKRPMTISEFERYSGDKGYVTTEDLIRADNDSRDSEALNYLSHYVLYKGIGGTAKNIYNAGRHLYDLVKGGNTSRVGKVPKVSNTIQRVSRSQAERVADSVKGKISKTIKSPDGKIKGYVIEYGNKNNPDKIRLMNSGSGGRNSAYYRITKSGKGALDKTGKFCGDQSKTHFDINPNTLVDDIRNIITKSDK